MKNLHLLPTDKPSKLTKNNLGKLIKLNGLQYQEVNINQHIYITSDEEIKEGDWVICWGGDYKNIEIVKLNKDNYTHWIIDAENYKKIILTTDQDLIKDGVQAIDDDFLEWFVKNPTCDRVLYRRLSFGYKIIIPQEKPKLETLEEAAERFFPTNRKGSMWIPNVDEVANKYRQEGFNHGAKWQAERMYSYDELRHIAYLAYVKGQLNFPTENKFNLWIQEHKKK